MDYDDTNGDMIVEDKGTDEPAVIIQKKNPRKGINDEALEKAEERIKSEDSRSPSEAIISIIFVSFLPPNFPELHGTTSFDSAGYWRLIVSYKRKK